MVAEAKEKEMEVTQSNRGHTYLLRTRTSSKSDTKTSAINSSWPHKKPKQTDGLQGKPKAQPDKTQASNVSSQPKLNIGLQAQGDEPIEYTPGRGFPKLRVATGAELEMHCERMRELANKALGWIRTNGGPEYRVVKVLKNGLAKRPQGLLEHLNFDAQRQDDPNAPVELFFAEFTAVNGMAHEVIICRPLGYSHILKQKYADTRGCCACRPNTVYHPPVGTFGLQGEDKAQGDELRGASNVSSQPKLNIGLQAQGDEPIEYTPGRGFPKLRVATGAELEMHCERMRELANKALGWIRTNGGPEYRVVKVLKNGLAKRPQGLLEHLNFDAQRQDDPNAPVELFFAEFTAVNGMAHEVIICRPLGYSHILKQKYADTRGCCACRPNTVYHPPVGTFGLQGEDKAQGDELRGASDVSSQPKLNIGLQAQGDEPIEYTPGRGFPKLRVATGAELEMHCECMRELANKALGWIHTNGGPEYRVVKVLKNGLAKRPQGLLEHLNFDAQRQDDPNAPVELFFAEFTAVNGMAHENMLIPEVAVLAAPTLFIILQ